MTAQLSEIELMKQKQEMIKVYSTISAVKQLLWCCLGSSWLTFTDHSFTLTHRVEDTLDFSYILTVYNLCIEIINDKI